MNNESECFTGISKHEKTCMKTRARSAGVFIHCFRVFGYPGETRARVVYESNESRRNRMFSFADLNRILNQA